MEESITIFGLTFVLVRNATFYAFLHNESLVISGNHKDLANMSIESLADIQTCRLRYFAQTGLTIWDEANITGGHHVAIKERVISCPSQFLVPPMFLA